jgi:hypothetical protein
MPTFDIGSPGGRTYSVTGPEGATPEEAFAMPQHRLRSGADPNTPGTVGGRAIAHDASPADWGAIPLDQGQKTGSAAWGAVPLSTKTEEPAKNPNEPGVVSGLGRAAARGAPIVGGLLNRADAATNAALSYGLNPLYEDQLKGTLGERYHQALDI